MKTITLEGRGFVTAVICSIGARHDGAHDLVTDGLYVDLRRALRNPADDPTMWLYRAVAVLAHFS